MSSKLVKALASTHEETREEAIDSIDKYILINGGKLSQMDVQKLWKGLYYSMWLCDGGENQVNLSENLARIFNSSQVKVDDWVKYNDAFWAVIIKEWSNIDQWRMDKYYLLIRRFLRANFKYLRNNNWDKKYIEKFNKFMKTPLGLNKNMAIAYHLCDIYLDELENLNSSNPDEDDEQEEEEEEEEEEEVKDIDTPELIVQLFKDFSKSHKLKTYREKIKEDILQDTRAKKWWFGEDEDELEQDQEDDEGEDEWTGF